MLSIGKYPPTIKNNFDTLIELENAVHIALENAFKTILSKIYNNFLTDKFFKMIFILFTVSYYLNIKKFGMIIS
jgi:hypothetical protein